MSKFTTIDGKLAVKNGKLVTVGVDPTLVDLIEGNEFETYVIPQGVTKIRSTAFQGATPQNIIIPNSVIRINANAFHSCPNLKKINVPNTVTFFEDYIFRQCIKLEDVTLENGLTRLGPYMFMTCSNLKTIDIPDSVTFIDKGCFTYCDNLTYLFVPKSVTNILGYALNNGSTTNKATIRFERETPPTIATNTFDTTKLDKILVPKGYGDTYRHETIWCDFADYIYESED